MYSSLVLFFASLVLRAATGFLAAIYLRGSLSRVLADLCGNAHRADFWTRMVAAGFIAVPMGLTLAQGPMIEDPITWTVVRGLFSVSLNGVLLVLLALGIAMWRQLPRVSPGSAGRIAS